MKCKQIETFTECVAWPSARNRVILRYIRGSKSEIMKMATSTTKSSEVCGSCGARVKRNEEGLKCDERDKWFHTACQSVNNML